MFASERPAETMPRNVHRPLWYSVSPPPASIEFKIGEKNRKLEIESKSWSFFDQGRSVSCWRNKIMRLFWSRQSCKLFVVSFRYLRIFFEKRRFVSLLFDDVLFILDQAKGFDILCRAMPTQFSVYAAFASTWTFHTNNPTFFLHRLGCYK